MRGLLWRSHPRRSHFSEQQNLAPRQGRERGGRRVLLDERVRRGGQPPPEARRDPPRAGADDDVAFVGGIDLCHGRHDDARHLGDPQAIELDDALRRPPPWHDVQLEVHGPGGRRPRRTPSASGGRTRTRSTTATRCAAALRDVHPPAPPPRSAAAARRRSARRADRTRCRSCAPTRRSGRAYPFAPEGERSIARAYLKAFGRGAAAHLPRGPVPLVATRPHGARRGAAAHPELHVVAVVPRYPDRDGRVAGAAEPHRPASACIERSRARRRRPGRASTTSRTRSGTPDLRARQGLHRRRRVDDGRLRQPQPPLVDPRLRAVVLRCSTPTRDEREPARSRPASATAPAASPRHPAAAVARAPRAHEAATTTTSSIPTAPSPSSAAPRRPSTHGTAGGRVGSRPPGHVRIHQPDRVPTWHRGWAHTVSRVLNDPDGRSPRHKRADHY